MDNRAKKENKFIINSTMLFLVVHLNVQVILIGDQGFTRAAKFKGSVAWLLK